MFFSSHRFGNLTRHADVILCVPEPFSRHWLTFTTRYMNDSLIIEKGTHNELLEHREEYARTWLLQAQAFLP
jgi:hypothetical protein